MDKFFLSEAGQPVAVVIIIVGLALIGFISYLEDKYGD